MDIYICQLTVIICVCLYCGTDSAVVTTYNMEFLVKYYQALRHTYKGRQGVEAYTNENLYKYCHALRRANRFRLVNSQSDFWQPSGLPTEYIIDKETLDGERKHVQIHATRIRVVNSSQLLEVQTFWCLNRNAEPTWLVAPAFIPASAFLFSATSLFSYINERRQNSGRNIDASFEGIIDQAPTYVYQNPAHFMYLSARAIGSIVEDPICNLHSVLQYRICALVTTSYRFRDQIIDRTGVHETYLEMPISLYYHSVNLQDRCMPVNIAVMNLYSNETITISRKMLQCYVSDMQHGAGDLLHLSLNLLNPHQLFFFHLSNNTRGTLPEIYHLDVPLLRHVKEYNTVLKKVDNFLSL